MVPSWLYCSVFCCQQTFEKLLSAAYSSMNRGSPVDWRVSNMTRKSHLREMAARGAALQGGQSSWKGVRYMGISDEEPSTSCESRHNPRGVLPTRPQPLGEESGPAG